MKKKTQLKLFLFKKKCFEPQVIIVLAVSVRQAWDKLKIEAKKQAKIEQAKMQEQLEKRRKKNNGVYAYLTDPKRICFRAKSLSDKGRDEDEIIREKYSLQGQIALAQPRALAVIDRNTVAVLKKDNKTKLVSLNFCLGASLL